MKFTELNLKGAFVIELERKEDERGFFARSFCQREFQKIGLNSNIRQCDISYNKQKGALRGIHYQTPPYEEDKIVQCVQGAIYDVIIDLRKNSSTYCKWIAIELKAEDYTMLYCPKGFAHGFQTLKDNTVIHYQMSEFYYPKGSTGLRWDDPTFNITWPIEKKIISQNDQKFPLFKTS